jgi:O-Antigen ligase
VPIGDGEEQVISGVQDAAGTSARSSAVTLLPAAASRSRPPQKPNVGGFLAGVVVAHAALYGLSGFLDGSYDLAQWGPIAVVAAALLLAASTAAPIAIGRTGWAAVAGLGVVLVWGLVSVGWADSLDRVWTEVARVGFYAVALMTGLVAVRSMAAARLVVGAFAVTAGLVGLYVVVRCLIGEGSGLFFEFRLFEPLGYSNGEAAFFVMAFWAVFAAAEGAERPGMRGGAMGLAVMLLGLVVLTQSRGALAAAVAAAGVALLYPERVKRAWLLLLAVGAVAAASPWLLDVYAQRGPGPGGGPDEETVRTAVTALVLAAGIAGALWGLTARFAAGLGLRRLHRAGAVALVALAVATVVGGLAAMGDPLEKVRSDYDDFVSLEIGNEKQRFTSTGGYRYDYWRIAVRAFEDSPLEGLGAGNYASFYLAERTNPDYLTQPHSLSLQLLAELGVVGALGLLAFAAAVLWAILRQLRRGLSGHSLQAVMAFSAIFITWFVHTNVDWLHNIPGITGMALLAAGTLISLSERRSLREAGPIGNVPTAVLMCFLVLLSGAIGVKWLAERYEDGARDRLRTDPHGALTDARRSLDLNPERPQAYFVQSAAFARLGEYRPARRALLLATTKEPRNYVPWALLGDLAVRRGDFAQARRDYARASELNPFEHSLVELAKSPRKALRDDGD